MTSTIDRSFTGTLDIDQQAVSATVRFVGDGVSLLVGGEAVGTWDRGEIEFVPDGTAYELRAEGDSIRFDPDDVKEFETFLSGSESAESGQPSHEEGLSADPDGVGFTPPPIPSRAELPGLGGGDSPLTPPEDEAPAQPALFSEDVLDDPVPDLSPAFDVEEDEPEPAISWDSVPDEMYAAGLSGNPGEFPPPPFRPAVIEVPGVAGAGTGEELAPDDARGSEDTVLETAVEPEPYLPPVGWHGADEPGLPAVDPAALEEDLPPGYDGTPEEATDSAGTVPDPAFDPTGIDTGPSEPTYEPVPPTDDSESAIETAASDTADVTSSARLAARGAAIAGFARNLIGAFRDRPTTDETEPAGTSDEGEDSHNTPEPIDDRENLRQWGLVVAGGLVLLALIAMVTWGLASILGGDEPGPAAEATPTTTATTAASIVTTTSTTTPPLTTLSPENQAAAAGFVESWNHLATQYAYHLSISADRLPISVAPAPTVHLTYDEAGVLGLKMAPKGTGSDRDLLLAMGLAVAWGDPSLSPEGRKEVLGAMGVDVDDPQLQEMGGSLSRNGVTYEATVSDGLIEFRVAPEA